MHCNRSKGLDHEAHVNMSATFAVAQLVFPPHIIPCTSYGGTALCCALLLQISNRFQWLVCFY